MSKLWSSYPLLSPGLEGFCFRKGTQRKNIYKWNEKRRYVKEFWWINQGLREASYRWQANCNWLEEKIIYVLLCSRGTKAPSSFKKLKISRNVSVSWIIHGLNDSGKILMIYNSIYHYFINYILLKCS